MPKSQLTKCARACKVAHASLNLIASIFLIAQAELTHLKAPFTSALLPIELLLIATFSYYVMLMALMLSCSVEATYSSKCFVAELLVELSLHFCLLMLFAFLAPSKLRFLAYEVFALLVINMFAKIAIKVSARAKNAAVLNL